jgi:hypothetical protein
VRFGNTGSLFSFFPYSSPFLVGFADKLASFLEQAQKLEQELATAQATALHTRTLRVSFSFFFHLT